VALRFCLVLAFTAFIVMYRVQDSPTKMKKLEFVFDIFAANAKRLVIAAPSDFLKKQWMIKITYARARAAAGSLSRSLTLTLLRGYRAAVNDFKGPTDSERKRTQAEVDKELLRLAEHIRGQQAQQRARAIPIHMAQGIKQSGTRHTALGGAELLKNCEHHKLTSFR
jgi:hypothetical protein